MNRLDTDTSGMLYFARSRDVYKNWRDLQKKGYVEKYYLAQVWGDVGRNVEKCIDKEIKDACYVSVQENNQDIVLRFPLMHHKHDVERMVSCATVDGLEKLGTK